jgi:hypothetical protein
MRKAVTALTLVLVLASVASGQVVPPAPGVDYPDEVLQSIHERGPGAFQFKRAWIEKTRKIRETREAFVEERGFYQRDMIPAAERPEFAVTGNYSVPVFCAKYSDTGADPYPVATLQTRLFNGPYVPRTMTQFYDEISYGDLNLTGTVYGWTTLPGTNAFYTGAGTCNGLCGTSQVDEFIKSTLTANDGARLFLDGRLVIDAWSEAGIARVVSAKLTLEAGRACDLRLEYFENIRDAEISRGSSRCRLAPPAATCACAPRHGGPGSISLLSAQAERLAPQPVSPGGRRRPRRGGGAPYEDFSSSSSTSWDGRACLPSGTPTCRRFQSARRSSSGTTVSRYSRAVPMRARSLLWRAREAICIGSRSRVNDSRVKTCSTTSSSESGASSCASLPPAEGYLRGDPNAPVTIMERSIRQAGIGPAESALNTAALKRVN